MKPVCRWILCAAPMLAAAPVAAQSDAPQGASSGTRSARELLTGLDVFVRPTYGGFYWNDQNAFYRLGLTTSGERQFPRGVPGADVRSQTLFERGLGAEGGLLYRLAPSHALGVLIGGQTLDVPLTSPLRGSQGPAASMWAAQALYRFAMTGAVTPVFEGSAGYGRVTHGADWSGQQTFEAALARLGAGVQFNFEPVRGALISGGLLFAVEGWLPLAHDHTGPAADVCAPLPEGAASNFDCSIQPNLRFLGGLDLRVTFALSRLPPVEFVRIDSHMRHDGTDAERPDVHETPAYRRLLPSARRVALLAPTSCTVAGAAGWTGRGTSAGDALLLTQCGVQMAEVERQLARQGFTVHTWATLERLIRDDGLSPLAAARRLGAEVLFQVNSLERINGNADRALRWEQVYTRSNEYGDRGASAMLPDRERATLRGLVHDAEVQLVGRTRLGAALDVTAIDTAEGRSVWFYRWNHTQPFTQEQHVETLVQRVGRDAWRTVTPLAHTTDEAAPEEHFADRDAQTGLERGDAADPQAAQYHSLVREVITSFVTSFQPASVGERNEPIVAAPDTERRRGRRVDDDREPAPPAVATPAVAPPAVPSDDPSSRGVVPSDFPPPTGAAHPVARHRRHR